MFYPKGTLAKQTVCTMAVHVPCGKWFTHTKSGCSTCQFQLSLQKVHKVRELQLDVTGRYIDILTYYICISTFATNALFTRYHSNETHSILDMTLRILSCLIFVYALCTILMYIHIIDMFFFVYCFIFSTKSMLISICELICWSLLVFFFEDLGPARFFSPARSATTSQSGQSLGIGMYHEIFMRWIYGGFKSSSKYINIYGNDI